MHGGLFFVNSGGVDRAYELQTQPYTPEHRQLDPKPSFLRQNEHAKNEVHLSMKSSEAGV